MLKSLQFQVAGGISQMPTAYCKKPGRGSDIPQTDRLGGTNQNLGLASERFMMMQECET